LEQIKIKKWRDENRFFFFKKNIVRNEFFMLERKGDVEALRKGRK